MKQRLLRLTLLLFVSQTAPAQNVGIGTASPTKELDVNGNLRVRALSNAPGGNSLLRTDSAGNLLVVAPTALPLAAQQSLYDPVLQGTVPTATGFPSVAVQGNTAYVVTQTTNSLQVFDCSNPAAPVLKGTIATGASPLGIAVSGTTVYVTNNSANTLQIFDCSNPASPLLKASTGTGLGPVSVAVSGTTAYVVNLTANSLQLFDCADPAAPVAKGTIGTASGPRGVAVVGTRAYVVCSGSNALQIFDCANSLAPVFLGSASTGNSPRSVAVSNGLAYVLNNLGSSLELFDCTNPTAPLLKGSVSAGFGTGPVSLAVSGTKAFVVNSSTNQLAVFDCVNPSKPSLVGTATTGNGPRSVAVSGTTAFVATTPGNSLQTFRLFSPRVLAQDADGSVFDIAANGLFDNLGNHTATQNLNLGNYRLVGAGNTGGLAIAPGGGIDLFSNLNLSNNRLVGNGGTVGLSISNTGTVSAGGNIDLGANRLVGGGSSGLSISNTGIVTADNNINLGSNQLVGGGGTNGISITGSGNVGIGTTSPNAPLQFVNGLFGRKIVLWEGAANDHRVFGFGINPYELRYQVPSAADAHIFLAGFDNVSSSELLRINGNGSINIGGFNTAATLEFGSGVAGKNIDAGKIGYRTFTADALDIVGAGTTGANRKIKLWAEGGLTVNGVVFANSFSLNSDARFKKNIQPAHGAAGLLRQLKGVSYYFDKDRFPARGFPDGLQYGFLAQEVEKVFPTLVSTDEKGYKSVNYIQLIPVLTEAVKEQQLRIEQQQAENERLLKRMEQLEALFADLKKRLNKQAR